MSTPAWAFTLGWVFTRNVTAHVFEISNQIMLDITTYIQSCSLCVFSETGLGVRTSALSLGSLLQFSAIACGGALRDLLDIAHCSCLMQKCV